MDEVDLTEEELERQREEEYQRKVRQMPGYEERRKAIELKLKQMQAFIPAEEERHEEEETKDSAEEVKKESTNSDTVFSKIKERCFEESTEDQQAQSQEPPKKMSKFKMRQMRNKQEFRGVQ